MFVCSLWCVLYRNLSQCQILLDKLFDILDKFYKLLIFNGLFLLFTDIFGTFDTSTILLGLMMGAS